MADIDLGAKGTAYAIETFCFDGYGQPIVDGVIRMTGFFCKIQTNMQIQAKAPSCLA